MKICGVKLDNFVPGFRIECFIEPHNCINVIEENLTRLRIDECVPRLLKFIIVDVCTKILCTNFPLWQKKMCDFTAYLTGAAATNK